LLVTIGPTIRLIVGLFLVQVRLIIVWFVVFVTTWLMHYCMQPIKHGIAQRAKKNGCNGHEKNAKKNKINPDDDDASPPSLTKGSHAPHVMAQSEIQGMPALSQILLTENLRTLLECNNDGPHAASCCNSLQRPEPPAF